MTPMALVWKSTFVASDHWKPRPCPAGDGDVVAGQQAKVSSLGVWHDDCAEAAGAYSSEPRGDG